MTRRKTAQEISSRLRRDLNPRTSFLDAKFFTLGKVRNAVLCVLLTAATIALYSPMIGHPFVVLDDNDYVTGNLHVQGGVSWSTIQWAFTSMTAANWHPLTWLSHALDCQFFGLNAAGHHADSLLLHALNVVLLFLLLQWVTGRAGPSFVVAALFASHPLNVESVAWVAERKNLLSTTFFFGAVGTYAWYAKNPNWLRYLGVVILFAGGLMAKAMIVTLPFVLLLLDYWPLGRALDGPPSTLGAKRMAASKLVLDKIPLIILSAASAVVTLRAQRLGSAVRTLYQVPFVARVENAVVAYGLYLWKAFWPSQLAAFYPHSASGLPPWQWISSGLILTSITALAVTFRSRPYLLVGWLWFLGILVPVIGLVQVGGAAMADRYSYLPVIGIFVIVTLGLSDLATANGLRPERLSVPAICVLIALCIITHRQIGYWDSEYDLWAHALAVTTANPFAQDAIASALLTSDVAMSGNNLEKFDTEEKRQAEARHHYERALALRRELAHTNPSAYLPDVAFTLINLGNLERNANNYTEARLHYEEAVRIHERLMQQTLDPLPEDGAAALANLGNLERSHSENEKATVHFESALEIYRKLAQQNPEQILPLAADVLNNLAVIERDEKHVDDARRHYEELLPIRRRLAEQGHANIIYLAMTLNDLGILCGAENRNEDARQHYEESLKIYDQLVGQDPGTYTPYLAGTLSNLALLYGNQQRFEESRTYYSKALNIYEELFHQDPNKYASDVARVQSSLQELDNRRLK
jgi:tetratricopeptide (TPR) repeat protein